MDFISLPERADHVRLTLAYLESEANIGRLIELTCGRAAAGRAALDLALRILYCPTSTNWSLLAGMGLSPLTVIALAGAADRALGQLERWCEADLREAWTALAASHRLSAEEVEHVLCVLVLHHKTPIPLPAVFAALGRTECMTRLSASTQAYRLCQMVT